MQKFTSITSKSVVIDIDDIDTDMIIPAQYLTSTSKEGFGVNLFKRLKENDPLFPLNLNENSGREILIAGKNFGCGSSREHAVWALMSAGFRVIIAESFADIFSSNSGKNGLLLISLSEEVITDIKENYKDKEILVDLKNQSIVLDNNKIVNFAYDPFRKSCLLEGLDDLDYLINAQDKIRAFKAAQKRWYVTTERNN